MPYTFILKGEPKSLNGSKNHMEFEKELLDQFKQKYPDIYVNVCEVQNKMLTFATQTHPYEHATS